MPIPLTCPECSAGYELPDDDAGQMVECACGATLRVPTGESPTIEIRCINCGSRYHLPAEDAGSRVECACGQLMTVPAAPEQGDEDRSLTLAIRCPACSNRYVVPVTDAGEKVECECGKQFRIPRDALARAKRQARERDQKTAQPAKAKASEKRSSGKSAKGAVPASPTEPIPSVESAVDTASVPVETEVAAVESAFPSFDAGDDSVASAINFDPTPPETAAAANTPSQPRSGGRNGLWIGLTAAALLIGIGVAIVVFRGESERQTVAVNDANGSADPASVATVDDTTTPAAGASANGETEAAPSSLANANNGGGTTQPPTPTPPTPTPQPPEAVGQTPVSGGTSGDAAASTNPPPGEAGTQVARVTPQPSNPATTAKPEPVQKVRTERPPRPRPKKPVYAADGPKLESIRPEQSPRTFLEAKEVASNLFRNVQLLKREIDEVAQPKPEVLTEFEETVRRAAGAFEVTLERINSVTPAEEIYAAEYALTFLYVQMRHYWKAGVMGGYVARQGTDANTARESAFLALSAGSALAGGDRRRHRRVSRRWRSAGWIERLAQQRPQ
ncbi:MAG: hypothetical protein R3B90_21160 [Planctomycetaceae bacterium]